MIKYSLKHIKSGNLCGFLTTSNCGSDYCNDISFEIDHLENENVWLVSEKVDAEYVRTHNTEWFNAGYKTPENRYSPDELEVIKIELNFQ